MAHSDLLLKPVAVSVPASSCRYRCDRPRLGPPRLALYSLTESARTPFHAEPTQTQIESGAIQQHAECHFFATARAANPAPHRKRAAGSGTELPSVAGVSR